MKKLLTLLIFLPAFLLIIYTTTAQNKATLMISQDAKLALIGDDKGNEPFTTNLRLRSEWQGNQLKQGYFFGAPEIEYADLQIQYIRTSLNLGYTHNMFSDYFELSYSVGYGVIMRDRPRGWVANQQFGGDLYLTVKLNKKVSVFLNGQIVDRNDLKDRKLIYSNFIGFKYEF